MRVLLIAVITIAGIFTAYHYLSKADEKPLPIINPVDVKEEMVDRDLVRKGIGHRIGEFSFTDQRGKAYGLRDVKDKIFVAEYFFTSCGTICPVMTAQMERVQKAFKGNERVKILSFTVDPENDTVARMAEYAKMHGADSEQWHFLTGRKQDLYSAARRYFFILKPAEAENQGDAGSDFIHTNNFVLVDGEQRIRGYYDGTDGKEVDALIRDIGRLLEEEAAGS
jgi:protein SCO1